MVQEIKENKIDLQVDLHALLRRRGSPDSTPIIGSASRQNIVQKDGEYFDTVAHA